MCMLHNRNTDYTCYTLVPVRLFVQYVQFHKIVISGTLGYFKLPATNFLKKCIKPLPPHTTNPLPPQNKTKKPNKILNNPTNENHSTKFHINNKYL